MRRLLLLVVAVMALAGCVGPAGTTSAYRGKASHAAQKAISALQTAAVAVDTSKQGNLLGPYFDVVLSSAEDDFNSVQQQFDSMQPPDTKKAEDLRAQLDRLLSQGSDTLSQLRILARRAKQEELIKAAQDIPLLVGRLTKFQAVAA